MAKISQRYDSHIEGYNKITEKSNEETTGNIESCRVLTIDSIKDISKGNATAQSGMKAKLKMDEIKEIKEEINEHELTPEPLKEQKFELKKFKTSQPELSKSRSPTDSKSLTDSSFRLPTKKSKNFVENKISQIEIEPKKKTDHTGHSPSMHEIPGQQLENRLKTRKEEGKPIQIDIFNKGPSSPIKASLSP